MLFVHNLPPLQSCGRGPGQGGWGWCCPLSVTHGQPQRTWSITSGPGILLARLGEVVEKLSLSELVRVQQVGTSHFLKFLRRHMSRFSLLILLSTAGRITRPPLSDMTSSGTFLRLLSEGLENVGLWSLEVQTPGRRLQQIQ